MFNLKLLKGENADQLPATKVDFKGKGSEAGVNLETEKKYPLNSAGEYESVKAIVENLKTNPDFIVEDQEPRDRVWKYLDTSDKKFFDQGISFSVRDRGKDRFVTIKIPTETKGTRLEYEFSMGEVNLNDIKAGDITDLIIKVANNESTAGDFTSTHARELLKHFEDRHINLNDIVFSVTYISSSSRINIARKDLPHGKVEIAVDKFIPIWARHLGDIDAKDQKPMWEVEIEEKGDKKKLKEITNQDEAKALKKTMINQGDEIRRVILAELPQNIRPATEAESNKYRRAINNTGWNASTSRTEVINKKGKKNIFE